MIPMQKSENRDCERDVAVRVLETFADAFADLTPEEIERVTAWALVEVRAEQRTGAQELGDSFRN